MFRPVIDNATARRLFLARHGLGQGPGGAATGEALADLIADLGFVQVDSVTTVARAHDMILWSRRQAYRPRALRHLLERRRDVFEHWTHDAAVVPVAFFGHWRLRFARDKARLRRRWITWHGPDFEAELAGVLRRIADQGPLGSADLGGRRAVKSTGWWDWHPSKAALEYLWRTGDLCVTRRAGFAKIYDLTARVIPAPCLAAAPSEEETLDWACASALARLGFGTAREIAAFWDLARPQEAAQWVARGLRAGRLEEVEITLADGGLRRAVMASGTRAGLADLAPPPGRLRLLSPFDPALRDRARAERLFGFRYRIEIFVPRARRRYGYYVFPVLEGARLIGRIDVTCDRDAGALDVAGFWPEPGIAMGKGRLARLEAELDRLGRFTDCPRLRFAPGWLHEAA